MRQSASRYAGRAGFYDRGRPDYPDSLVDLLSSAGGVEPPATVVDLGTGTGILAEQLLRLGYEVCAIDNDPEMLSVADNNLASYHLYRSVCAPAEESTLRDHCAAAVTIGQALHWFDLDRLRTEIQRVLVPGGPLLALWNEIDRSPKSTGQALDHVLADALPDYVEARSGDPDPMALVRAVAPPGTGLSLHHARHHQLFTVAALRDRILSTSYAPSADDVATSSLTAQLDTFFEKFQNSGKLRLDYVTTAVLAAQQVDNQIDAPFDP